MNKRDIAVDVLKGLLGLPYKWGGNDRIEGFDCSGLMLEVLHSAGVVERNKDFTAEGLSNLFPVTEVLQVGVMVFWDWNNDGKFDHVEMIALVDDSGEIFTIGASGGDSRTINEDNAMSQNAFVKLRPMLAGSKLAVDPFI